MRTSFGRLFHRFTSRPSPRCLLSLGGLCFCLVLFVCALVFAGSLVDAFLNRASNDMTATVSSNAAVGEKWQLPSGYPF